MFYINSTPTDALASLSSEQLSGTWEDILVLSFPPTAPDEIHTLLDNVTLIVDEQERTIHRYTPRICHAVADLDGRTYARLRLVSHEVADNPALYHAESAELLNLLGETAELEYQNAIGEIENV